MNNIHDNSMDGKKQNPRFSRLCILCFVVPVSQICALITFPSTLMLRVANSTPIVDFDSRLNSFRVKRERRLDLPTPESPIRTTGGKLTRRGHYHKHADISIVSTCSYPTQSHWQCLAASQRVTVSYKP